MKTLLVLITILLSGCMTTYQYTHPSGESLTIKSYREFPEGIKVVYDGSGFRVESGSVTNGGDVKALSDLMMQIIPLIQPGD